VKYQVTDSDGAEKTSIRNIEVKWTSPLNHT
jgi:hypothetical protein